MSMAGMDRKRSEYKETNRRSTNLEGIEKDDRELPAQWHEFYVTAGSYQRLDRQSDRGYFKYVRVGVLVPRHTACPTPP